jgi:hypothetical protein
MDNSLIPQQQNDIVEDALRSYPLAEMPKGVAQSVMARLQTHPQPRFRMTPTDYLTSIILTFVLGAIILGFQLLPPYAVAKIQIQGILLWQSFLVNFRWLLPLTSILLGTSFAGIALYQILRFERR